MAKNKFGLTRDIPRGVKRSVRKACGFGCVICGNAIYEYEHIDPTFAEAKEHAADRIALLCGTCHGNVTRKVWSKDKIIEAKKNPQTKSTGFSSLSLDINQDLIIRVGNTSFKNLENIIEIEGQQILGLRKPAVNGAPPQIMAQFYDSHGAKIASIVKNEWRGSADAFDIETIGSRISVRSKQHKIDLSIKVIPPNEVVVEKLNLTYLGNTIMGTSASGFNVTGQHAVVVIHSDSKLVEKAPHWLKIEKGKISLGDDAAACLESSSGDRYIVPGTIDTDGAKLEFLDLDKNDDAPPGFRKGDKIMRITALRDGGGIEFCYDTPENSRNEILYQDHANQTAHEKDDTREIGRLEACSCGSGLWYKKCHGKPA